jgi:hypothetical protein
MTQKRTSAPMAVGTEVGNKQAQGNLLQPSHPPSKLDRSNSLAKHTRQRQPRDHTRYRGKFPLSRVLVVRLRELTALVRYRYALGLDTDDADQLLLPIARLLFRIYVDKGKIASDQNLTRELAAWRAKHTPLISDDTVSAVAVQAMARPELENKTVLGRRVMLTAIEREALSIGTIRPFDLTPVQFELARKEKRRARNRAIQTAKRRKAGAVPREQYLAQSRSRTRPWEAQGISRATYYRTLLRETGRMRETGPSPTKLTTTGRTRTCLKSFPWGNAARKRTTDGASGAREETNADAERGGLQ